MASFAGLDEAVIADAKGTRDFLKPAGHVVAIILRPLAKLRGALRHLDGVLVVAHQEKDLVPLHAAVAGLDVGAEFLEGGADVGPAIGVVDGGGLKESRRIGHLGILWKAPPLRLFVYSARRLFGKRLIPLGGCTVTLSRQPRA